MRELEQEQLREKYVYSAQAESQQGGALGPGAVLRKGAAIAVRVIPNRPCFAYLVRCTPSGKGKLLSPPPGEQAQRLAPHAEQRLPSAGWLQLVDDTQDLCLVLSTSPLHPTSWDFCAGDGREPDTKSNDTIKKDVTFAPWNSEQDEPDTKKNDIKTNTTAPPPLRVLVVED